MKTMKKILITFSVIALGIASAQGQNLPCCDHYGPAPDSIVFASKLGGIRTISTASFSVSTQSPGIPSYRPQHVAVSNRKVVTVSMGPDGTVYIVGGNDIETWNTTTRRVRPLAFNVDAAIGKPADEVGRIDFNAVGFSGSNRYLLWTTISVGTIETHVTSLSDYSTVTLDRAVLANDFFIAPNTNLYLCGGGPALSDGVHAYSAGGTYLRTLATSDDITRVRASADHVYVQSAHNAIDAYTHDGRLVQSFDLDKVVADGKLGVVHGMFVHDDVLHIVVVPAYVGGDPDVVLYGWEITESATLYQLVRGDLRFHSNVPSDALLYGITPDGLKVGRSLLVGSSASPAIMQVGD